MDADFLFSLPVLALLGVVAAGTYFQTVTGFGLGMIVMGVASGLGLAPVPALAALVSLLSLANCLLALPGALHHLDWRAIRAASIGLLPAMAAGVLLLGYLDQAYAPVLKLLLGAAIVYGGVSILLQAPPGPGAADKRSFFISGVCGGLFSGLFSLAGPPLVYQFYRQEMSLKTIRYSLIFLFAISAGGRSLMAGSQGQLDAKVLLLCMLALPVGVLATMAGKRYPPPIAQRGMRRIAFAVLTLIGLSLMAAAVPQLLG
ncbi:MAG: TSUP family transporter [Janthinobacterium svalbardensis]